MLNISNTASNGALLRRLRAVATILVLVQCVACSSRSNIEGVVKGFFGEINQSHFETAKARYLSTGLINLLNSPLTAGEELKAFQTSFKPLAGFIQSLEIAGEQVKGEEATLSVVLVSTWGTRVAGRIELIKEGGRDWKISHWDVFEYMGYGHVRNAMNYCNAQYLQTALSEFNAAIAENPHDAMILDWMGKCYGQAGNFSAAEMKFSEAIKLYPDVVWTPYLDLGNLYAQEGKLAEAESALERAVKNKPNDADCYNSLAWFYADHGLNLDRAIELAQKALSLSPESGYILDTVGWAYYKKGMRVQALQYLSRAREKEPNNSTIQAHVKAASTTTNGRGNP